MKSMLLPLKNCADPMLRKHTCFQENSMLILAKTCHISIWCRDFCQEDASLLGEKISCEAKVPFPLVHACFQDMQQRSKHHPFILVYCATGQIEFRLAPIFIGSIQYFIAKTSALHYLSTRLIFFSAVLMGLLSGPCSWLLPDVQTTASSCVTIASKIS
jgi:hypothetical protein